MPSPIAHSVAGYTITRALFHKSGDGVVVERRDLSAALLIAAGLSLLPDLGSVAGALTGDFARFHNSWEHSLMMGLVAAGFAGGMVFWRQGNDPVRWSLLTLLCYELHVLMDFFTWGRGVKIFWPFSAERFKPPLYLFYGLHWSDGWLSQRHLVTLATEMLFAVAVIGVVRFCTPSGTMIRSRGGHRQ